MMFSYDEMNPLSEKRQLLRVKSSTERILCNKIPITVREKKEEKTVKSYKNDCIRLTFLRIYTGQRWNGRALISGNISM